MEAMFKRILHFGRRGHSRCNSRQRGFSVVELMISVTLVAIGAALALPSYQDMVEKRQLTNGTEQLAAFVNTAQGIAMRTNRQVTLSFKGTDASWCVGLASDDAICQCDTTPASCQVSSQTFVLDNVQAGDAVKLQAVSGENTAYYVDPIRGLFLPCDPVASSTSTCARINLASLPDLADPLSMQFRSNSGAFRLNLMVNNTGRVTLCSDSASHAVPGYPVCPATAEATS
ncbi:MAG: GspH/FimT family pseudopilin [Xanthomonadales bacterium]|nr:GspH/FimT family pseudopilin [Xanthomonadales bacterium]